MTEATDSGLDVNASYWYKAYTSAKNIDQWTQYYYTTDDIHYVPISASGFDSSEVYFDYEAYKANAWASVTLTSDTYEPNKYYSTQKEILTNTISTYLNTGDMIGQVYAFAAPQNQ